MNTDFVIRVHLCSSVASGSLFMDDHRIERVSEAIREELYKPNACATADPRLISAAVTRVPVNPDSPNAAFKVAIGGGEHEQAPAMAALHNARHYLRHELA